jgi:type II secretory pathway pseudopilin PulG
MGLPAVLAIIGVGAGIASAQASAQATATQRRQAQQQAMFERRRAIRQTIMERQLAVNIAASTGLEGGSAAAGGIASIGSQLGTNLGYGSLQSGLSNQYYQQTQRAQTLGGVSSLFTGLSNVGFGMADRGMTMGDIFKPFTPTAPQMGQPTRIGMPLGGR